jgi:transposase
VELFEDIRLGHGGGLSIRDLSVKHRVHRRTVRQALAASEPPVRKKSPRSFPVAGRWEPIARQWLEADANVHRKQRHTAQRIWERLVDEHGAQISPSAVRAMVARLRAELGQQLVEVTVSQTHGAGAEAEVDFGEFFADLGDGLVKVHMFVMRLSCSGRAVHYAYSAPSSEAFLDGHVRAFAAFGAVPGRIRYDNLTAAVTTVLLGRGRIENQRFVALRSHYGFDSFFCIPGIDGAHEKGGVEGEIGRFRRRHLTPVPVVSGTAELNAVMHAADCKDEHRHIGNRRENVGAAFAAEAASLRALPVEVFDPSTIVTARVDAKARVAVRACHYSVPARLAGRRVEVAIGGMSITVRDRGTVVAVHERSIGKGQENPCP